MDTRQENWLGCIELTTLKMAWPMAILAIVILITAGLFLYFGEFTEKQRVTGRLIPASGLPVVEAGAAGVVAKIHVTEAQLVERGQPLLEISTEVKTPGLGGVASLVDTQLKHQLNQLQADLAAVSVREKEQRRDLQQQISRLKQQLAMLDAQQVVRQKQLLLARDVLARVEQVEEQHLLSAMQMQQYRSNALEAQAQVELATLQRVDYEQQLATTQETLARLPAQMAEQRRSIERNIATIQQSIIQNEAERSMVVTAPRGGRVSGLMVTQGQAITVGQRLLAIMPQNTRLLVELWAPTRAMGKIANGQRVTLRYHAFPYQDFGQHYGRIIEIADGALLPDAIQSSTGLAINEPAFRVLVTLDQPLSTSDDGALAVRANMTLDADLLLERLRLYRLLQPTPVQKRPSNPPDNARAGVRS